MKTDFYEDIIELIRNSFSPVTSLEEMQEDDLKLTLTKIYNLVVSVLPRRWIEETDVQLALEELGYKYFAMYEQGEEILNDKDELEYREDDELVVRYLLRISGKKFAYLK